GEASRIYVSGSSPPGSGFNGETRTMQILEYDNGARAFIHDEHHNIAPSSDDWYGVLRVEGTEGIVKGSLGGMFGAPTGIPDRIQVFSRKVDPKNWIAPTLEGQWFPDAFLG